MIDRYFLKQCVVFHSATLDSFLNMVIGKLLSFVIDRVQSQRLSPPSTNTIYTSSECLDVGRDELQPDLEAS